MHGGPSQGGHSHQSKAPPLGSGRGLETMPEDDGDDILVRCMACWWACSTCHVVECTADSVVSAYHDVGLLSQSTPKLQYPPHPPPLFRYGWGMQRVTYVRQGYLYPPASPLRSTDTTWSGQPALHA